MAPNISPTVRTVIEGLENNFSPKPGEDIKKNVQILSQFSKFNKLEFEAYLSKALLISLNDEEFELLQDKVGALKRDNSLEFFENIEPVF